MDTTDSHTDPPKPVAPNPALRLKLLHRRDELASAAVEHTSHDLPGADELWQALHQVEERVRALFPAAWERHNGHWAAADAARLHTPDFPRPQDCRLCARFEQLNAPPQAS